MFEKLLFIIVNIIIVSFLFISFIVDKFQVYAISLFIVTMGANLSLLKKGNLRIKNIPLLMLIVIIIINIAVLGLFALIYIFNKNYLLIASIVLLITGLLSFLFLNKVSKSENSE